MKIDMGDGPDWPSIAQAFAAVVALGVAIWTLMRDRRREARADHAKLGAAFDLAIELGRFFEALQGRAGETLTFTGRQAGSVMRSGEFRELLSLLDDVRPSEIPAGAADAYRDIRALVRDVEGWLIRAAGCGDNERSTMPMGEWKRRFKDPHRVLLRACNRAAERVDWRLALAGWWASARKVEQSAGGLRE